MRLPEQRLWDSMKANAPRNAHLVRIENLVVPGTPDVCSLVEQDLTRGVVSFVELKARADWPARESSAVLGDKYGLNPDQVNWHMEWTRRSGRSHILIGIGTGNSRHLYLLHGVHAPRVNKMTREEFENIQPLSWDGVFEILGDEEQ